MAGSYLHPPDKLEQGDLETGFAESDHVVEGETNLGGQEHFYLETQTTLVIPRREKQEVDVYSSCQYPDLLQVHISI